MQSAHIAEIEVDYDVVVVGSGYGGAVCAARLSQAGRRVCVLERGRELQPGAFPTTGSEFARAVQVEHATGRLGKRTSLFRFLLDVEYGALVGCGLGGTSLINAGVAIRPSDAVWREPRWPEPLRADHDGLLREGFERAEAMLRPTPYGRAFRDTSVPRLSKLDALEHAAGVLNGPFSHADVTIAFSHTTSAGGVEQPACSLCGDCLTGCNTGAKTTVLTTYLPLAVAHGARLFTEIDVRHLERVADAYNVYYEPLALMRDRFRAPLPFVRAPLVVLAAGALGSTEILLRSRARGLAVSRALGRRFSGNGTTLAFAYDGERDTHAVGAPPGAVVGPAIAGMIDLRFTHDMLLQDTNVPRALSGPVRALLSAAAVATAPTWTRRWRAMTRSFTRSAATRTLPFAVTARDASRGELYLDADRLRVRWPGAGHESLVGRVHERVALASDALSAHFVPNPAWRALPSRPLVTTHPLGGCAMASDGRHGVVDHRGRVFVSDGAAVHDGLYVCDGAVFPGALGCNPLLTITALAERCAALIARDRGWSTEHAPTSGAVRRSGAAAGLRFTERMIGYLHPSLADELPPAKPPPGATPLEFVCTLLWDDLEALLLDPSNEARSIGTLSAPLLGPRPLTVQKGRFRLCTPGPEGQWRMQHRLVVRDTAGASFFLDGHKTLDGKVGRGIWRDTTTLFFTVYAGESAEGAIVGKGAAAVRLADLARQASTMRAQSADGSPPAAWGRSRFLASFARRVHRTYGGLVSPFLSLPGELHDTR